MPTRDYILTSCSSQPLMLPVLTQLCQCCHPLSNGFLGLAESVREPGSWKQCGSRLLKNGCSPLAET